MRLGRQSPRSQQPGRLTPGARRRSWPTMPARSVLMSAGPARRLEVWLRDELAA